MANLGQVLKEEIGRLARKEIKVAVAPLQENLVKVKKTVSDQKKQIIALEKELARMKKKLGLEEKIELPSNDEVEKARFAPATIARLRKKLGLSRSDMASILEVNPNSIYLWEQGKANPRAKAKAKLLTLRTMGKRDIKSLLES